MDKYPIEGDNLPWFCSRCVFNFENVQRGEGKIKLLEYFYIIGLPEADGGKMLKFNFV